MFTLTERINNIHQPRLGYLPVTAFKTIKLKKDNQTIKPVDPYLAPLQGMVVDYQFFSKKAHSFRCRDELR